MQLGSGKWQLGYDFGQVGLLSFSFIHLYTMSEKHNQSRL